MRIILKNDQFETFVAAVPDEALRAKLNKTYAYRIANQKATEIDVDLEMTGDMLEATREALKAGSEPMRGVENQLNFWARMLEDPDTPKVTRLQQMKAAIVLWMLKKPIKGWLFKVKDDIVTPYLVTDVTYNVGSMNSAPSVTIKLDINTFKVGDQTYGAESIIISQASLPGTVEEVLAANGFFHETPALHEAYEESLKRYEEVQAQVNEQFHIMPGTYKGTARYSAKVQLTKMQKGINDDTLVKRHIRDGHTIAPGEGAGLASYFTEIPLYTAHYIYLLGTHEVCIVPSMRMKDYVYDANPESKIVLPEDHRRLIDILTNEREEIMEDVVSDKSGGNVIMLEGSPGLGKTLVAEIYSEKIKRPLYRLEAGLLGLDAVSVEKSLKNAYENAVRWDAVALIDEADIYVRKRNDDMSHNAIVATMLIGMERQSSLTFMATNRTDDIDDAILSRCIAVVRFQSPTNEDAKQIWRIQADTLKVNITDEVINQIVEHYAPDNKPTPSGRDIRNLLKLVKRFLSGKTDEVTYQQVLDLAVFRRM